MQMQKIIEKIPVDEDAKLRIMLENACRSAYAKIENEMQTRFSQELRADLDPFPSLSIFQKSKEGECAQIYCSTFFG